MYKKTALLLVLILTVTGLTGCGKTGTSTSKGTAPVTINVSGLPSSTNGRQAQGIISYKDYITDIGINVTGTGMDAISTSVSTGGQSSVSVTLHIPLGLHRTFNVAAYNADGFALYSGSATVNLSFSTPVTLPMQLARVASFPADCTSAVNNLASSLDFTGARNLCVSAASALDGTVLNEADAARFLSAFTRVMALPYDVSSDGDRSNGINTVGEAAESMGCVSPALHKSPDGGADIVCDIAGSYIDDYNEMHTAVMGNYTFTEYMNGSCISKGDYEISAPPPGSTSQGTLTLIFRDCDGALTGSTIQWEYNSWIGGMEMIPIGGAGYFSHYRELPANAPTGVEIQGYLNDIAKLELISGISALDQISSTYSSTWTNFESGLTVENDYGDVLAFKAYFSSATASILLGYDYDMNIDIGAEASSNNTTEQTIAAHPNILNLRSSADLLSARDYLDSGMTSAIDAIDFMLAEVDPQSDDFINLGNTADPLVMDSILKQRSDYGSFRTSLTGPSAIKDDFGATLGTLDLTAFFAGRDLHGYIPTYIVNTPGNFPDPTFGGTWTGWSPGADGDPNQDKCDDFGWCDDFGSYSDGIPDVLQ